MRPLGFAQPACDVLVTRAVPASFDAAEHRDCLLAQLADDERERYARFHFDRDRLVYLVAHALVRQTLGQLSGVSPSALSFMELEHGRPEISGPEPARALRFNLSHTHGLVICAVSRGPAAVGADVEHVDRRVELLNVAKGVFSARELEGLLALEGEAQRERFFELWTLKEAYIKAVGKGFALPLREITFTPSEHDPVALDFTERIADVAARWQCHRFVPSETHRIAVCYESHVPVRVHHVQISPDDLLG